MHSSRMPSVEECDPTADNTAPLEEAVRLHGKKCAQCLLHSSDNVCSVVGMGSSHFEHLNGMRAKVKTQCFPLSE